MTDYTIKLTTEQLNVIGVALLELPGKVCNPVIAEINKQVIEQQQAANQNQ